TDFFHQLGIKTIIEKSNDKKLVKGMGMINADFCAPMALSHGIMDSLSKKNVDFIFFPTLINEQNLLETLPRELPFMEKMTDAYFCYYASYAPTIIDNLPAHDLKVPLISPKIKFNNRDNETVANDLAHALSTSVNISEHKIAAAFLQAKNRFEEQKQCFRALGQKILAKNDGKPRILLLGRPYALFDKRVNLGIPLKLEEMGFDLVSQSMLDFSNEDDRVAHLENMHWYFGQQTLLAAQKAAKTNDLYPVFLTCFRCSPDAYLMT
ncbi:MAG: hypothetical protein GY729_17770, partial [Desulfobacteraceae bacterium]|nr:hypothetical protein [Desulfobacteraceae bacterium]